MLCCLNWGLNSMTAKARTHPPPDCLGYTWVQVNTFAGSTMMADVRLINKLVAAIYDCTTGQYYIGNGRIAFEYKKDAVAFKLKYVD